ncbi:MAG TPA: hypothetical protein PKE27_21530 [Povalibacter sp.]|uniref:hypothetical protein n=1 Tax=Povalibacter sp. TaxID=1962978 RepID=UPI002C0E5DBC|nr:hypothetical protein [Povalibacter sp.]HMN47174.1 hypothetical protein [Povalibacter sp.]
MLEQEATRKYRLELGASLAIYLGALFVSLRLAKSMDPGTLRTALLIIPVIPVMLAVWAIARHFQRMDEFMRLRSLESFAVAGAVTAGLAMTYGFLESAGFPKLSMFWVWGVMGATWMLATVWRCLVSR